MKTRVLVIGGGPGGSAAAMFLSRERINPVIVEQEEFSRFHIGESPFAFATFVHQRYRDQLIDASAGRIYETEHQPSKAIMIFRILLKRERDYDHPDDYSIPIGSRYHPERAPLWEPNSPVGGTEDWLNEAVFRDEFAGV